ncbi:FAD binding domain-containing protein [Parafannyhessea umbonata]|uniref:CO or xanthine dehydrogenase, FAD-binding subunit n=1 Tax=Parafannyhessea umbonata TaxID=604330 RepID=A0A1G6J0T5_9ACTN|nr:FAD binding domain-containing protein [Parafannyhessea umbonata]SDC12358.1 CO or xanthine dehydrogenase, FAD-binding subunit [Parafannyhessea umbonata]
MVNGFFPQTLDEALELRSKYDVVPYAGGTDLMVQAKPNQTYLFVGKLPELRRICEDDQYVRIGAAVTFTEALASPLVPQFMKEAVALIAAPAIRNAGTFGGNLGNGSAKADSVLVEYATGAKIRLASVRGERVIDIDKFYKGRKQLDLASDELIVEVLLPKKGIDDYYYHKVGGRQALAISRVSFGGLLSVEEGTITRFTCAFGAVSGTVLRYPDLEGLLVGKTVAEAKETKENVLSAYAERMQLTRGRVSAEYRKKVCLNLLDDFLSSRGI